MYCTTDSPRGALRKRMVEAHRGGMTVSAIAQLFKVARSTVYRWLRALSLESKSPVPHYQPRRTPALVEEQVRAARLQTGRGPWYIGLQLGMPSSTVYKILRRYGINRLAPPVPAVPVRRYEYARPGELVHIDVKKLGTRGLVPAPRSVNRQLAYECLHVMLDDCSRYVYCETLMDETANTATEFFERGVAHFAALGVTVQRALTDNGSAYRSQRWRDTFALLGARAMYTRPRRPQTNGKVERWNRTLNEEGLPARVHPSLQARSVVIENFAHYYNTKRRHKALNGKTPLQRLVECSEGP